MPDWYLKAVCTFVFAWFSLVLPVSHPVVLAEPADNGSQRLQELLYGEALFHSQQQNYFSAITRLQLEGERGTLPPSHADAGLLLARLKLAYGLERATVRAIVIADGEYVQDHVGRVENGLWKVPGCIIGRAGRDSGSTFWIKARAQSPAGGVIVSETVAVVRK